MGRCDANAPDRRTFLRTVAALIVGVGVDLSSRIGMPMEAPRIWWMSDEPMIYASKRGLAEYRRLLWRADPERAIIMGRDTPA